MTTPILIEIAVGDPSAADGTGAVSLVDAVRIAAAAEASGVTALRLLDAGTDAAILDASVVAAHLAGRTDDLGYLVDVPTTHHAPYNVARRILSFDRAAGGRAGVVLRPGTGDEVSDAAVPDASASDPGERWAEYARIVTRLWESFPREALLGDQEAAIVADDTLIRPIAHVGRFYRVAGPLDGPSSVQGRPVLVAAPDGAVDWATIATSADVVVVDGDHVAGADAALTAALDQAGRRRDEVALVGRRVPGDDLVTWAGDHRLDAAALRPTGGIDDVLRVIEALAPLLDGRDATLRGRLGLGAPVAVA